ncbi:MAG: FAD-binding oxidoreductase [Myxococcales bacterium]
MILTTSGAGAAPNSLLRERNDVAAAPGVREKHAEHARKVARISQQLRNRKSTAPLSIRKKAVSHQVPKAGDLRRSDEKVDVTDLDQILEIDPVRRTCTAEPGVTFVDLVTATMKHGLVPIIVPEFKTITIGGAVSGCSIESMSYKYGGFHDTCLEYEVITATGEVLTCTPDNENSLVFQMIHGSFGTLGIVSKLKFRLVPSKPYVKMKYEKYGTLEEYQAAIWRVYQNRDWDFMDGIIHSPTEYVLSLGNFVDEAPYTNSYDWLKVYYQSTSKRKEDFLKTPDYFFRYDRGVTNVHPKSFLGRLFFGKFMGSTEVLKLAEKFNWLLPKEKPTIILDVFIPFSKVPAFMEWYGREFKHFPLWCVPYKRVRNYEWISDRFFQTMTDEKDELFVDLAIYGMKQTGDVNYHKLMEDKLLELGGIKTLISHNYYSEEDFWKTWNKPNYDAVKARVDPHNIFRDLYTKMCKAAMGVSAG